MEINATSLDKDTIAAVKEHNVKVVPTCIYVDRTGKIRGRSEGSLSKEQLTNTLDEILPRLLIILFLSLLQNQN